LKKIVIGAVGLAIVAWFVTAALLKGRVADRCADELAAAVASKDRAYVTQHVRNPSLSSRLLDAARAEFLFVRPVDADWSRIGFAVRMSETATVAEPVFVLLSHEQSKDACSFIQDYQAATP
jgi:hypothetical protein